jgi:PAS domain S-box-containing protein
MRTFLIRIIPYIALLIGLYVLAFFAVQIEPDAFLLTNNPYATLSGIALLGNVAVLLRLNTLKVRDTSILTFSLVVTSLCIWSATEFIQRLSLTVNGYIFWDSIQAFGWVTVPVVFLIFTLNFVKSDALHRHAWIPYFLAGSTALFLYLGTSTGLIDSHNPVEYFHQIWGYDTITHPYLLLFMAWLEIQFIIAFMLLWQAYKQASAPTRKDQIRLIMMATAIPIVGGTVTDGLLPSLGFQLMPVAVLLTAAMSVVITYAMFKYRLLSFNPATVASNILGTMQEAVLVINPDYTIDYGNQKAVDIFGLSSEQLIGTPLHALCPHYSYESIEKNLLKPLLSRPFATLSQITIGNHTHHLVPASLSAATLYDDENAITGYVLAITDISTLDKSLESLKDNVALIKRKNLQLEKLDTRLRNEKDGITHTVEKRTQQVKEEHAKLVASIDSLNLGYIMVDPQLRIVMANSAAAKALAIPATEWPPHDLTQVNAAISSETDLSAHIYRLVSEKQSTDLHRIPAGERFLDIFLSPIILEEKVIGAVIVLEDVTEALILERTKDEFFTIASHELRTPLTAIRGYTELIKTTYAKKSDATLIHMLDRIEEGSSRLMRIVNDFLDVSRLEQGKIIFRPEEFSIEQLIDEVLHELEPIAKARHLDLSLDSVKHEHMVYADLEKTKQVMVNLVGNALKFTERGGIHIDTSRTGNRITVKVHDTGLGIAKGNQHLLFGKFQQAGSSLLTRDASDGTGVGLYICKRMVEGMDGEIRLDSSVSGRGSVFAFTLPIPKS